jgi:hypothetical protein
MKKLMEPHTFVEYHLKCQYKHCGNPRRREKQVGKEEEKEKRNRKKEYVKK